MAIPYTGFFDTVGGTFKMKASADLAADVDMNFILSGTNVQMRTTPLNPTFPSTGNVVTRQGTYGWANEYLPTFVTPLAAQVQLGVFFGALGTEFVGTLSGGTPPATPTLTIKDDRNGTTATAIIQGSATGSVNKVYTRRVGSTAVSLAGTRTGNGVLTITPGARSEYFSMCTSTLGGTSATIGNHFWVSKVTAVRANIRDGGALAAMEIAKQVGIQIDLVLNATPEVITPLWAIDRTAEDITTIHGGNTGVRGVILEIPRQIGWPPSFVPIQSYVVIPSGSVNVEDRYGIDNLDSVNDSVGIKSVFTLHCSRMDQDNRLGG